MKAKMSIVGSRLIRIFAIFHCLGCIDAGRFTNGFPNVLVTSVFRDMSTNYTLHLIPEMNFTCNGSIVGYTVAGRRRSRSRFVDPIIQVWRPRNSSNIYYGTSTEIAISETVCAETSTVFSESPKANLDDQVWQCNLNATNQVPVQAGDILGLLLPPRNNASFRLSIANVSRGPTNYVFEKQEVPAVNLCDVTRTSQELPQIAVQVESESDDNCSKCVSGFPDMPVFDVDYHTNNENTGIATLIPDMNFTRPVTIAGFIVADQEPSSKIQIWRQNNSQPCVYYQVEPGIVIDKDMLCVSSARVVNNVVLSCILNDEYQVSVEAGDFLGLELPQISDDSGILFTSGGPTNYIFKHKLTSPIDLSDSDYSTVAQQPQIAFNLTSDQCTSGFLNKISTEGERQGNRSTLTTNLFPNLTFGCYGTIVRLTVAVAGNDSALKFQIWRKNETHSGVYYNPGHDILISNSSCEAGDSMLISGKIFQCTLSAEARVSVQPGDILGLELPPTSSHNGYEILFNASNESATHIFQRQLFSTVNLSEADNITNSNIPQIIPLVILDENEDSCSNSKVMNSKIPQRTECPSPMATTATTIGTSTEPSDSISPGDKVGIVALVIIVILLAVITILVAAMMRQWKRWKAQKQAVVNGDDTTYSNLAYNSRTGPVVVANSTTFDSVFYTAVSDEIPDGPAPEYDEIIDPGERSESSVTKGGFIPAEAHRYFDRYCSTGPQHPSEINHYCTAVQNKAVRIHLDNQNYVCGIYETDNESSSSSTQHLVGMKEDDLKYWEPAATVNELYRQLSSKKYREIPRQQVEMKSALGSGQFGEVNKGIWQSPMGAMDIAVKQLQPGASEEEKVKFLQEAAINGQFRHPNVVQLMGVVTVGEPTMIMLELMSNGDLRNFLIKQQPQAEKQESVTQAGVDKHVLLRFCQHIASGMSYLSLKAFVHRDLAARNILVSGDKICKISDFGMSRNLMDANYYVSHGGKVPVKWTAPEAIHYKKYSTASDVWSFGCVMYEIWSLGHKPFENHTNPEAIKMVDEGYRLPPPPGLSRELYKIMIHCWQPERNRRPTFPQLVEMLSRADFELFVWEEVDLRNSDPQVKLIGAPLKVAKDLYLELQRIYASS